MRTTTTVGGDDLIDDINIRIFGWDWLLILFGKICLGLNTFLRDLEVYWGTNGTLQLGTSPKQLSINYNERTRKFIQNHQS
jgi:hypothetical protein